MNHSQSKSIDKYSRHFLQLIHLLMNSQKGLSIEQMANQISMSKRTINYYLKEIRDEFSDVFILLNSEEQCVKIVDEDKYRELKNKIQISLSESSTLSNEGKQNKICDMLIYLLEHNDYRSLEEMAEQIFYSASSLKKELNIIRKILNDFNLQLISKTRLGMKIEGEEFFQRFLLSQIIEYKHLHDGIIDESTNYSRYYNVSGQQRYQLKGCFLSTLSDQKVFILSNPDLKLIYKYLFISIARSKENLNLSFSEAQKKILEETIQWTVAQQICLNLKKIGYDLNHEETYGLALLMLVLVQFNPRNMACHYPNYYQKACKSLDAVLQKTNQILNCDISLLGQDFKDLLADYLTKLYLQKQFMAINCSFIEEEKKQFTFDTLIGQVIFDTLQKQLNQSCNHSILNHIISIVSFGLSQYEIHHEKINVTLSTDYGYFMNAEIIQNLKQLDHNEYIDTITIRPFYETLGLDEQERGIALLDYPNAYYERENFKAIVINPKELNYYDIEKKIQSLTIQWKSIFKENDCNSISIHYNQSNCLSHFMMEHHLVNLCDLQEIRIGENHCYIIQNEQLEEAKISFYINKGKKTWILFFKKQPSLDFIKVLNHLTYHLEDIQSENKDIILQQDEIIQVITNHTH